MIPSRHPRLAAGILAGVIGALVAAAAGASTETPALAGEPSAITAAGLPASGSPAAPATGG